MRRACGTAVLVVLLAAPMRAQLSSGEIRLVVTDATGLALIASGVLASDASQTSRPFDTDAAGRFTFDRLPAGRYRLTIAREPSAARVSASSHDAGLGLRRRARAAA